MKALFAALALLPNLALATPVNSQVIWITKGLAEFHPASGIFINHVKVMEADGSHMTITCESGPFTPYTVDGRVQISDYKVGKPDRYGQPTQTGSNELSRRYATSNAECASVLQQITKRINQFPAGAQIILNNEDGSISIGEK